MAGGTPGSPDGIRELARQWAARATAANEAAKTLRSAKADINGGELRLRGVFAPKVQETIGGLPDELEKLGTGYGGCSAALSTYATTLHELQGKHRRADTDRNTARRDRTHAEAELDRLAPGWESWARDWGWGGRVLTDQFGERSPEIDLAIARRDQAQRDAERADALAEQAAKLRATAEEDCARDIRSALEGSGLKNRDFWHKAVDWLERSFTTWDGFVRLCENLATVLGVVALFLSGPLALIVGAVLLATALVAMADTLKQFRDGKIGWKELAAQAGMTVLDRVGGRALGSGVRALQRTKTVKTFSTQTHRRVDDFAQRHHIGDRARHLAHRGICTVTGHPVDVATGKVFTDLVDFALPGPVPLTFERIWYSTSTYAGPLGHGWHHTFDAALLVGPAAVLYRTPDGRHIDLLPLDPGDEYFERTERLTVARDDAGYRLTTSDGLTHLFAPGPTGPDEETVTHLLRDVVNRSGHRISLSHDDRGRLVELVDSGGRDLRFEHDDAGRVVALTAPHPDTAGERFTAAWYAYDALGNLVEMTDALGQAFRYEYEGHLLVRETDRTGLSFLFEYDGTDERARCLHTWGDGGIYDHRIRYEPGGTTVTDSLGHETRHGHEGGVVVRTVDAQGGESRTKFEHQQPVEEVDALGRVTTYEYDSRGNQVSVARPDGSTVESAFDERDLPVSAVDPVGGEWAWTYDDRGLLRERRDPLGRTWTFDYAAGLLASVSDPAGGVTSLAHDHQGSIMRITTPDGASSGWRRNALGWPAVATDPLGNDQVRHFDLAGRVVRVDEPDGNVRQLEYDGEGNLLHAVDRLYDVRFSYQGMGRLASREQAGTTVRFEYDTEEQLIGVVNEHGHVYRFAHSPTGEVTTERGFDGVLRLYERDVLGRVVSVRRASGIVSRYRYDDADRVTAVEHSDGMVERFAYRLDGALVLAENETIPVRFERDALGRVTREWQGEHWVDSEYDALGFRVRVRSSLGLDETIERNAVGDVTAVSANGFEARFTRDALGQELTRELPGGVRSRWHRDKLGRPLRQEIINATGLIHTRAYDWDVNDRLRGVVDGFEGLVKYEHDPAGRLISAMYGDAIQEFRWPAGANDRQATTDRPDRLRGLSHERRSLIADQTRWTLDSEGRRSHADDGTEYDWSPSGLLKKVLTSAGGSLTFEYDALGRRTAKGFKGATRRHWIWDGDVPLHEWDEADAGPSDAGLTWVFEDGTFAPLIRLQAARREGFLVDQIGTPFMLVDGRGSATWQGSRSVLGDLRVERGDIGRCPFGWAGQYKDEETGLHYNRFRYYDSSASEYVSQDPLGLAGGLTPYGHVPDPLVWVDVLGLRAECNCGKRDLSPSSRLRPPLPFELTQGANAQPGYSAYVGRRYAGMTKQKLSRRERQHPSKRAPLVSLTQLDLTRGEVRAIEQALIERNEPYKGYENARNSISPHHDYHEDAVAWGQAWLADNRGVVERGIVDEQGYSW